ncbi:MAG TPA: response regulator [Candidatus Bathyarchaeia archaeon]|nr:response regulator [Candidatus Bathyarchaeia archaeon]
MCKIMIVEDNQHIRKLFKNILNDKGYDIIEVEDGEKAIKIYDRLAEKPEIIVVDYRLPTLNGLEFTQAILARDPTSSILMISGDPKIDKSTAKQWGIRFCAKPITKNDLISEIENLDQTHHTRFDFMNNSTYLLDENFQETSGRNGIFVQEDFGYKIKLY